MITPRSLVRHELIGLRCLVATATGRQAEGMVINETRNTLTLDLGGTEKTFPKGECTFVFTLPPGDRVRVDGRVLVGRPEDRTKKKLPKW